MQLSKGDRNVFNESLRAHMHDPRISQELRILSGAAASRSVRGIFNFTYGDEQLGRKSIETVGGEFLGLAVDLTEVRAGDEVDFDGQPFHVVAVAPDGHGTTRLDLGKRIFRH